jgi:hypothetical protein
MRCWSIKKNTYGLPSNPVLGGVELMPMFENELVGRKEKWVTLSNDALSLMQLLDVDVEFLKGENKQEVTNSDFVPGEIYAIGRDKVEGVEFDYIYFRVYGVIRDYKGVNLDSVIVKEVTIDEIKADHDFDEAYKIEMIGSFVFPNIKFEKTIEIENALRIIGIL